MSEENWKDSLPEQIKDAPYFKNAESVDQVLADLTNAAQWQGQSIRIPGEDATPEALGEFHQNLMSKVPGLMPTPNTEDPESLSATFAKLGRPDTPDGYSVPEGVTMDVTALKAFAHANNLTAQQFSGLVSQMNQSQAEAGEQYQAELQGQYATLNQEWGAAYEQNMTDIGKLLATAPESVQQAYKDRTLPADQLRWLHSISQLGEESAEVPGQGDGAPVIPTPEQAELQLAELEDRLFKMEASDPAYQALNAKRMQLIAYSQGVTELPPMRVVDG